MGWGVGKDRDRACRYYQQAAERGSVPAKLILARMMILDNPNWSEKAKGIWRFASAVLEAIRIGRKNGFEDERVVRW